MCNFRKIDLTEKCALLKLNALKTLQAWRDGGGEGNNFSPAPFFQTKYYTAINIFPSVRNL